MPETRSSVDLWNETRENCVFCRIANGLEEPAGPNKQLTWWPDAVAFEPLNPVVEGHTLVVPRMHASAPCYAGGPEAAAIAMSRAGFYARSQCWWDCNYIVNQGVLADQTVRHIHVHVIPRREGDGLLLPWTGQRARM